MWLKHKYSYRRCHWWNFKFLTLDLDSPGKIHPNTTSNNPIRWGHIFLQCSCRTNVTIAGVIDWIFNFHGQIQNLLEILVRMMYNTTWLSKIYIITKEWPRVISEYVPGLSKKTPWHCQIVTGSLQIPWAVQSTQVQIWDQTWSIVKGPMVHVRMAQVDHYEAEAISCNHQSNMLKLIAGDIWYPKVIRPFRVSRVSYG